MFHYIVTREIPKQS